MDEDHAARIGKKMMNLAEKGIDALADGMDDEEQSLSTKIDATKTALEALGFLGKASQGSQISSTAPAV